MNKPISVTDSAVAKVTALAIITIVTAPINPTFPTTHPVRRNRITPRIVSIEGVKTPMKVPSFSGRGCVRRNLCVMGVKRATVDGRIGEKASGMPRCVVRLSTGGLLPGC